MSIIHKANFEPFSDNLIRITEEGNIRITEISDTRITDDIIFNKGSSGLYIKAKYIPFYSRLFYKVLSKWSQFFTYVKHNNIWKVPQKMYTKINGFWKRAN